MRKRLLIFCMLMVTTSAYAFISNYKTWTDGDVFYSTDINGNFSKTNAALDSMLKKSAARDSISNVARDSLKVRQPSTILLPYTSATGDSFYSGDSLTVEITRDSPLGNATGIWVKNATGKPEKVLLFWDAELPNNYAHLDSIRSSVWTELTTGADFAAFYVKDDSTRYDFKNAQDSTGSMYSATARTLKVISKAVSTNNIVGGRFRVSCVLQMNPSDSMFVGPVELIVTNR
jgi:hypothetical protein